MTTWVPILSLVFAGLATLYAIYDGVQKRRERKARDDGTGARHVVLSALDLEERYNKRLEKADTTVDELNKKLKATTEQLEATTRRANELDWELTKARAQARAEIAELRRQVQNLTDQIASKG